MPQDHRSAFLIDRRAKPSDPTLRDGYFRKLTFADLPLFRDHLLRLAPAARHARFAMPASDHFLRSYAQTSFTLDTTIYAYVVGGHVRAVAELRPCGDPDKAEAAFSVESCCRQSGVGTQLMELTLIAARNRGCRTIYMSCLATNRAMQHLALKFTSDLTFELGDVVGRIDQRGLSPFSLFRETLTDMFGWLGVMVHAEAGTPLRARLRQSGSS